MNLNRLFILILLVAGLLISTNLNIIATSNPIELDQTRPDLVYRTTHHVSLNEMIKGNDTNNIDILYTHSKVQGINMRITGDPDISVNNYTVSFQGEVGRTLTTWYRDVETIIQREEYIPDLPVRERVSTVEGDRESFADRVYINRNYTVPHSFESFENNSNFDKIERGDYIIFLEKSGRIGTTELNNTRAENQVRIIAFSVVIQFYIFEADTQYFVGLHQVKETGYGNYLPRNVINYLNNNSIIKEFEDTVAGARLFQLVDSDEIPIYWASLGKNETYNLNMYYAGFRITKDTQTLLISPSEVPSLSLQSVPLTLELMVQQLSSENTLNEIDEDGIELLNNQVVERVLTEDDTNGSLLTPPTMPSINPLDFRILFAAQVLVILLLPVFIYRRINRY
jgi:hypothetical protein